MTPTLMAQLRECGYCVSGMAAKAVAVALSGYATGASAGRLYQSQGVDNGTEREKRHEMTNEQGLGGRIVLPDMGRLEVVIIVIVMIGCDEDVCRRSIRGPSNRGAFNGFSNGTRDR